MPPNPAAASLVFNSSTSLRCSSANDGAVITVELTSASGLSPAQGRLGFGDHRVDRDLGRLEVSISNMERLQLILVDQPRQVMTGMPEVIEALDSDLGLLKPYWDRIQARPEPMLTNVRTCRLTAFGRSFASCCIDDSGSSAPTSSPT